jgi:outer membrane receptor for ferrienterochelin and colicin
MRHRLSLQSGPDFRRALLVSLIIICLLAFVVEIKAAAPELEVLKDQDVSIADLHEVPISEASANVYVITDEDIRHSGATDIPTLLRRIPGMEVMQMTGANFNVSVRGKQSDCGQSIVGAGGRPFDL